MKAKQDSPCNRLEREWLDDLEQAACAEHLATCATCRAAAARYRRVIELIEEAGPIREADPIQEPPDGWDERLLARLDAARTPAVPSTIAIGTAPPDQSPVPLSPGQPA